MKNLKDESEGDTEDESDDSPKIQIRYPFYEYKDNMYCEFMLKLMNMLEIRFYKKNALIAAEMDECMELLFV